MLSLTLIFAVTLAVSLAAPSPPMNAVMDKELAHGVNRRGVSASYPVQSLPSVNMRQARQFGGGFGGGRGGGFGGGLRGGFGGGGGFGGSPRGGFGSGFGRAGFGMHM